MSAEENDIKISITCSCPEVRIDKNCLEKLAGQICRRFGLGSASISIAIVDDQTLKKVNTEFLHQSTVTDVISFDLSDGIEGPRCFDLIVNAREAARQALKRGHSAAAEVALYITHGLLHNLGFDDHDQGCAQKMHAMEDEILQQAGFGVIYDK